MVRRCDLDPIRPLASEVLGGIREFPFPPPASTIRLSSGDVGGSLLFFLDAVTSLLFVADFADLLVVVELFMVVEMLLILQVRFSVDMRIFTNDWPKK